MDRARGLSREVTGSSPVGSTKNRYGGRVSGTATTAGLVPIPRLPYPNRAGSSDGESICLANRRSRVQVPPGPQVSTSTREQYEQRLVLKTCTCTQRCGCGANGSISGCQSEGVGSIPITRTIFFYADEVFLVASLASNQKEWVRIPPSAPVFPDEGDWVVHCVSHRMHKPKLRPRRLPPSAPPILGQTCR